MPATVAWGSTGRRSAGPRRANADPVPSTLHANQVASGTIPRQSVAVARLRPADVTTAGSTFAGRSPVVRILLRVWDGAFGTNPQRTAEIMNRNAQHKPGLSLCMIVKNEHDHLARCLRSAAPIVDEMVVVDTGSRDDTIAIARRMGARVFGVHWQSDFSAARNHSLAKASRPWILVLDADEVISKSDYGAVRQIVDGPRQGLAAYDVTTRNYTRTTHFTGWRPNAGHYPEEAGTGWYPSEKVRLFTRSRQIRFHNPVHELVEPSIAHAGIPKEKALFPVHHYGKLDEAGTQRKGRRITASVIDKAARQAGRSHGGLRTGGPGRRVGAVPRGERGWNGLLARSEHLRPEFRARILLNLSYCLLQLMRYGDARKAAIQSLALDPGLKEAALNCTVADLCLGRTAEAVGYPAGALSDFPDYPPALLLLAAAHFIEGRQPQGMACVGKLGMLGFSGADIFKTSSDV
jgi:hypothetical protein